MLTLVPSETYRANASWPAGPVVLSSLQAARTTRATALAAIDQLRFITSPQGWNDEGRAAGNKRLIISVITQRRATPEYEWIRRAHRALAAGIVHCPAHWAECQFEDHRRLLREPPSPCVPIRTEHQQTAADRSNAARPSRVDAAPARIRCARGSPLDRRSSEAPRRQRDHEVRAPLRTRTTCHRLQPSSQKACPLHRIVDREHDRVAHL